MEEIYQKEIVYKVPGNNAGPSGKTYDWKPVISQEEFESALKDGWFNTLTEAISGEAIVVATPKPDPVNTLYTQGVMSAPTRAEMLTKAEELGLEFHKNIKDKKLLKLIEANLPKD